MLLDYLISLYAIDKQVSTITTAVRKQNTLIRKMRCVVLYIPYLTKYFYPVLNKY